jgi:hypothetical protein
MATTITGPEVTVSAVFSLIFGDFIIKPNLFSKTCARKINTAEAIKIREMLKMVSMIYSSKLV